MPWFPGLPIGGGTGGGGGGIIGGQPPSPPPSGGGGGKNVILGGAGAAPAVLQRLIGQKFGTFIAKRRRFGLQPEEPVADGGPGGFFGGTAAELLARVRGGAVGSTSTPDVFMNPTLQAAQTQFYQNGGFQGYPGLSQAQDPSLRAQMPGGMPGVFTNRTVWGPYAPDAQTPVFQPASPSTYASLSNAALNARGLGAYPGYRGRGTGAGFSDPSMSDSIRRLLMERGLSL